MSAFAQPTVPRTDLLIVEQAPFLDWTESDYERLKQRILDRWSEVQVSLQRFRRPAS